jgi:hypothetical protein
VKKVAFLAKIHFLFLLTLSLFPCLTPFFSCCHGKTSTPGHTAGYTYAPSHAFRYIQIFNNTPQTIIAHFQRPDPGFLGSHVLVSEHRTLKPNTLHHYMILKNPDLTSNCAFTQGNQTLATVITADNELISLLSSPDGALQTAPIQTPEA